MIKNKWVSILKIVFVLAVAVFFGFSLYKNWQDVSGYSFVFNIGYAIFSVILAVFAVFCSGFFWRSILFRLSGEYIIFVDLVYIQFFSWLCHYLPGKVGVVLSKISLVKERYNCETKIAAIASVYDNIFMILASFIVSLPVLMFYLAFNISDELFAYFIAAGVFIISVIFVLQPSVVMFLLKKLRVSSVDKNELLSPIVLMKYISLYIIPRILNGIAFFLFVLAISNDVSWNHFVFISAGYIFASVIGVLAVFAPSGFGVREGVLLIFLKSILPWGVTLFISVLSRAWLSFVDLIILFVVLILRFAVWKRRKRSQL